MTDSGWCQKRKLSSVATIPVRVSCTFHTVKTIMLGNNIHLAPSDDEDLYSGFGNEEVAPALQTDDLEFDEGFQVRLLIDQIKESSCTMTFFRLL